MAFTFDPEIVLAAIEECVTVIRPGEVLAVRVPLDLDEAEMESLADGARRLRQSHGVRVVFVAGEEFGRLAADPAPSGPAASEAT